MSKTTIGDSRVRVKPSKKLLQIIDAHKNEITEIPANIANVLKKHGYTLPSKIESLNEESIAQQPLINIKLLSSLREESTKTVDVDNAIDSQHVESDNERESDKESESKVAYLYLDDLRWLNQFLGRLRKEQGIELYLHKLLAESTVVLPENEVIERNPVLEARCEKLRQDQQNREYMKMTKNVDSVLKHYPEDTIAYQMKSLNKQIIAVFQFVLSVVAGFVFGFLGLELIFGGLDFGLRLLMGIMFALIIALAEIYFLAKKLNEFDDVTTSPPTYFNQSPAKNKKIHAD